jgi:hypothetical protein
MTIKLITFKTNHTIMGDVTEVADKVYVKKPVQVVTVPPRTAQDQGSIAFSPFIEYAEEFAQGNGFEMQRSDILFISTPVRELENQYNTIFGSGIQIANQIPKL